MIEPVRNPVRKYKETVSDMNSRYSRLLWYYQVKDTRVEYLHAFELALANNLPFPLWENPRYVRITGNPDYALPAEGYTTLRHFKLYMILYYYIMADAGLLSREGADAGTSDEEDFAHD